MGLFLIALIYMLEWSAYFAIPVTAAAIVGLTLGPIVGKFERWGIGPRITGIILIMLFAIVGYLVFLVFAIPLEQWSARIPEISTRFRQVLFWVQDPLEKIKDIGEQVEDVAKAASGESDKLEVKVAKEGYISTTLASAPAIIGQLLIFLGTFYFFVGGRTSVRRALVAIPSTRGARFRVARTLRDVEYSLSRYLLTITVINVGFGVIVGLAMWVIGMPSPALWGALATVLNFVQYLGPALMVIILAGVSLITFATPADVLLPIGLYILLNLMEGQFITPALLGQQLVVNPLVVFLSLAFWLWLWGPIGAFLAVPILVIVATSLYYSLPPGRREPFSLARHRVRSRRMLAKQR